ncbi:hypothetical protein A3844_01610 [Paenibacillus helianthi]|uniref:Copper amine oxidase-like N-terminal domain-containing protein n=1 Tax=Paenibacillus helianthi TaxID=1349432 RepID=A0ABX3EWT4_9BACL|nr:hypothetical protein [Paenibacillus helianthi]OKP91836.1 hypothetical protein A3844_01610 [Paenibacillus helianthi]
MKKRIVGAVAVVLLLGGSIGFAAGTSLIGAKVTGTYEIEQGGKKIADAAIINGTAYVPVRIMSEATGTTLSVDGRKITLEKGKDLTTIISESLQDTVEMQLVQKKNQLAKNEDTLKILAKTLSDGYEDEKNSNYYKFESTEGYARTTAEIKRLTEENEKLKDEIAALEAQ